MIAQGFLLECDICQKQEFTVTANGPEGWYILRPTESPVIMHVCSVECLNAYTRLHMTTPETTEPRRCNGLDNKEITEACPACGHMVGVHTADTRVCSVCVSGISSYRQGT